MSNDPSPYFLRHSIIDRLISTDHTGRQNILDDVLLIEQIVKALDDVTSKKPLAVSEPTLLAQFRSFVGTARVMHPAEGPIPVDFLPWYEFEFTRLAAGLSENNPNIEEVITRKRQRGTTIFLALYTAFMNSQGHEVVLALRDQQDVHALHKRIASNIDLKQARICSATSPSFGKTFDQIIFENSNTPVGAISNRTSIYRYYSLDQ